jgi:hypothetical protein
MRPDEFLRVWRDYFYDSTGTDRLYLSSLALEFMMWAAILLLAALLLRWRPKLLDALESRFGQFSRRQVLAVVSVGVLALAVRLALLPALPIPKPIVHDEYSYILQAQTLASGRLTNPPHPLWVHFESFHINMLPTYQSMYPPGQALLLAFAQAVAQQPWWGVWLSVALMCAAITWMLQGWMPPHWALLGGLFCVLRFATFSYWVNSYWGGAVAAIGGALLFGSMARLMRRQTIGLAVLIALGLLLLANTRPFEGFVTAAPAIIWLLVWSIRDRKWNLHFLKRVAVPILAVVAVGIAGMLYYNWRSTGHALLMPYIINEHTYHITRPFLWQARAPIPNYHHMVMRTFYCFHELPEYFKSRQLWGLEAMTDSKLQVYYEFFLWPLLLLAVPTVLRMVRSRRMRIVPLTILLLLIALLLESWHPHGHYAAPALCLVITVVLYGMRTANTWRPGGLPAGHMLARALVIVVLCWSALPLAERVTDPYLINGHPARRPPEIDRARLTAQLERTPGQHLVIVHNHLSHSGADDWVYNLPDIDHAKVVWARDMGREDNEELLQYFKDRQVWLVDQNDGIMRLNAYNGRSNEDVVASVVRKTQTGKHN